MAVNDYPKTGLGNLSSRFHYYLQVMTAIAGGRGAK